MVSWFEFEDAIFGVPDFIVEYLVKISDIMQIQVSRFAANANKFFGKTETNPENIALRRML